MYYKSADIINDLLIALGPHISDVAAVAKASGIDSMLLGRIFHKETDPRLDVITTLARACGLVLMAVPDRLDDHGFTEEQTGFRLRGADQLAKGDLSLMREVLMAWRKTTGMTATALARALELHDKAILRIEQTDRLPRLTSVIDYIQAYQLKLMLVPEARRNAVQAEVAADLARRGPSIKCLLQKRGQTEAPQHPTPADILAIRLLRTANQNDITAGDLARMTGLHTRTLTNHRHQLDIVGQMSTTVRVATALGYEIMLVPMTALAQVETFAGMFSPDIAELDPEVFQATVSRQIERISDRLLAHCVTMKREAQPPSEITQVTRLAQRLGSSHTSHLANRVDELGFGLVAIPAQAVCKTLKYADKAQPPRRVRQIERGESTQLRNRRLVDRFFRQMASRNPTQPFPGNLPQQRTRLQIILDHMISAQLALDVIDKNTGERILRYQGNEAAEFFGEIISLRLNRGRTLHSIGAGVNLTHAAVRRQERLNVREHMLLSSVLRYAETLGLDIVPNP